MANGDTLTIEAAGRGFDDLIRDLDGLQGELDETAERARKVGAEEVDLDTGEARRRIEALRDDFRRFAEEADDPVIIQARAEAAQKEIRALRKDFGDLQGAARKARREVKKIEEGRGSVGLLRKSIDALSLSFKQFLANIATRAFEELISSMARLVKSSIDLKIKLDAVPLALRETLGGSERAAKGMEFLDSVSQRLGISVRDLADRYVSLTAATKGQAAAGEVTNDVFETIIVTGRAFGRTNDQIARALEAVEQIAGKTTVQMEELKKQLGQAIPGAIPALAKGLAQTKEGFDGTVKSLFKLVETGQLTADEMLPALVVGLKELSGEAAEDVGDRLAAQFGRLEVATEKAGRAFTEKLEPGLRDTLEALTKTAQELEPVATELGEIASVILGDFSKALNENTETLNRWKNLLADIPPPLREALTDIAGLFPIVGDGVDGLVDTLAGVPQAAKEAFEGAESSAVLAAQGITDASSEAAEGAAKSFAEMSDRAREGFEQQAAEAGISADKIREISNDLAADLVAIDEATIKQREELREILTRAYRDGEENVEELTRRIQRQILNLVLDTERKREEAVKERLQSVEEVAKAEARAAEEQGRRIEEISRQAAKAAQERIETERQAEDAIAAARTATQEATLETFDELAEKAGASAEERREIEEELADELAELENELTDKKADAVERFQEKDEEAGADREKLAVELTEKLADLDADANRKREALLEKRLEAVRKAADEEVKALERVRQATEELAADLDKMFDDMGKAAEEGESAGAGARGGGQRLPVEESLDRARESVEGLRSELDRLQFGESGGGLDPNRILEVAGALADAKLNVTDFADAADASGGEYEETTARMRENAKKLQDGIRELVFENERFAEIFPQLDATAQESIGRIVDAYGNMAEGAQLSDESARQVLETLQGFLDTASGASEGADTLGGRLQELAGNAGDAGQEVERTAESVRLAADGITAGAGAAEEFRKGLESWEEEARDAADKLEGAEEAVDDAADKFQTGGEAASEAAEGVGELGAAGQEAAPGLDAAATAVERLSTAQLPEELPGQLQGIGEAASTLVGQVGPLSETLATVTASLGGISGSVATISEAVPGLQTLLDEGVAKVAELVEQGNLEAAGAQLKVIAEALEKAAPSFESLATAATTFAEQGQPVEEAAGQIKTALEDLGGVGESLADLVDRLKDVQGALEGGAAGGEKIVEALGEVQEMAGSVLEGLEPLVAFFEERLPSAVDKTFAKIEEVRGEVRDLVRAVKDAAQKIEEEFGAAGEVVDTLKDKVAALKTELAQAADEAGRLADNLERADS